MCKPAAITRRSCTFGGESEDGTVKTVPYTAYWILRCTQNDGYVFVAVRHTRKRLAPNQAAVITEVTVINPIAEGRTKCIPLNGAEKKASR